MYTTNNKKLIAGMALLLIIIAILIAAYYFISAILVDKQNQPSLLPEKEGVELSKEALISEKKNKVTKLDCDNAKQELKDECLNLAVVNEALTNSDLKICSSLQGDWQDVCVWKLTQSLTAQGFEQSENCAQIKDGATKDNCYLVSAVNLNQEKICSNCSYSKEECLDKIKERNSSQLSDCINIKQDGIYKICLKNKSEDCKILKTEDAVKRCQSWRIYDGIIASGKKEDCTRLPIEKFKKVCEVYFDQGYIDSDNDGANDYEELNLGTDPFAFDKNISELKYGNIQRQTIIRNYYRTLDNLYETITKMSNGNIATSTGTEVE